MDYVDGKNFARVLDGRPLPAGQATVLLKTMAEAVHYAHQRGTLHRDLKPQNILIDRHGQLRITDFGLAKRVEEESGLTRSGAVLGSPSYMPPEQAAARQNEVGPASDVYALGAVFYEMLTGRPPFAGATPLETMQKVLSDEPIPPGQLNPKVPADLATICLKCLEKRPERRYPTAQALGDELQRFLNYEPILAKPASGLRRTWNWTQRNPWVFTAVFASLVLVFGSLAYGLWERTRYFAWRQNVGVPLVGQIDDSPAIVFFMILPLLCLLVYVSEQSFRRLYRRQTDQGRAPAAADLLMHGGLGMLGAISGIGLLFAQIKSWAWGHAEPWFLPLEMLSVPSAVVLSWMGF